MTALNKAIRHKRFSVKEGADAKLSIESKTGFKCELQLQNCSLSGIGAATSADWREDEGLEVNAILPAAKLSWGRHEFALGRVVLRSIRKAEGTTYVGISTIDSKVPIDGALGALLDEVIQSGGTVYDFELSPEKFNLASFVENSEQNIDLYTKCKQFQIFHKDWEKTPQYQYHTIRTPSKGPRINLTRKRRGDRSDYIAMGTYDYLGMATHPKVAEAAKDAIDKYGYSATGSLISTGLTDAHEELSEYLARALRKERVLLFNSGYCANVGTLCGITVSNDLIVADMISHASLHDAMQMAHATSRYFKHNDVAHLDTILKENRSNHAGALVVTEGIFSMDGDVAPLNRIVKVAKQHNARVFVDEAHSFGLLGSKRLGASERFDVLNEVDLYMGSLSKVFGAAGGFVAGSKEVMDWLYIFGRPYLFSGGISPCAAAAALAASKLILSEEEHLKRLQANITHFRKGLSELGAKLSSDPESPIIPLVIGNDEKLGIMNQSLLEAGVFVVPVVYPVVSRKQARFRFSLTASHTTSDLDYVLSAIEKAMTLADFKFEQITDVARKAA